MLRSLKAAKALARNILGFYFSEDTHRSGSVAFGGVEPAHISPNHSVHWFPIQEDDSWQIKMKDIAVNGERLHICDNRPGGICPALVDTGSSLITGPPKEITPLLQKIHTPDDCSNLSKSSDVTVILVDKDGHEVSYPLTPEEYTLRSWDEVPTAGNDGYFKEFPVLGQGKEPKILPHCEPGVGIMETRGNKWVLGNTFLRRYYSIYDDDRGQVGFVRSLHPDENVAPQQGSSASLQTVAQSALGEPLSFIAGFAAQQRHLLQQSRTTRRCLAWKQFL